MSKVSSTNTNNYNTSATFFTSCDIRLSSRVSVPLSDMSSGSLSSVDKESYRPNSVTTRNQLLSPGGVPEVGVFDFQDGKDSGLRPIRRLDLDRVQVDNILKEKLADAEARAKDAELDALNKAKAKKDAEELKQQRISEAVDTYKAVEKASKGD